MSYMSAPTFYVDDPSETMEETLARINMYLGHRRGYGRALELALPEAMSYIEQKWLEIVNPPFKEKWILQLQSSPILNEVPDIGPEGPETDPTEYNIGTTDDPVMVRRSSIRYTQVRTENAGFNRKMFSDIKELRPRLRFWVSHTRDDGIREWTAVKVKTNEHLVEFTCSARNATETNFLYKSLEYIFYTNARIFSDLGFQRHIHLGSPRRPKVDEASRMHQRVLSAYFRTEEYFYEPPVVEFTGLDYVWDELDVRFQDL